MTLTMERPLRAGMTGLLLLSLAACNGMGRTEQRVLTGGAIGAGAGAAGAALTGGGLGTGALIGGAVGAGSGYVYDRMNR